MSCKGCESDSCSQSSLLACAQWVLCPTRTDGTGKDCSKAPRLVSNSWGSGLSGDNTYQSVINAWISGGIIPIFANGNSGPVCFSSGSPGAYENVISVGATTIDSTIASFSSRGPVITGFSSSRMKPEVSAPGQDVYSAWNTNDTAYNTISGTSMATPHTSGVVALMLAAKPTLTYPQAKQILLNGCTNQELQRPLIRCELSYSYPNNEFGQGLINAKNSVTLALAS